MKITSVFSAKRQHECTQRANTSARAWCGVCGVVWRVAGARARLFHGRAALGVRPHAALDHRAEGLRDALGVLETHPGLADCGEEREIGRGGESERETAGQSTGERGERGNTEVRC